MSVSCMEVLCGQKKKKTYSVAHCLSACDLHAFYVSVTMAMGHSLHVNFTHLLYFCYNTMAHVVCCCIWCDGNDLFVVVVVVVVAVGVVVCIVKLWWSEAAHPEDS